MSNDADARLAFEPLVSRSFLDQIDADRAALEFLRPMCASAAAKTPHVDLRISSHKHSDGITQTLWVRGRIVAMTVVERDEFNRSILVCCG